MSFANVNEYNDMLRAQDRARACHRQQPQGLANYQAKKAAQEAARLAPFAIVKETYGNYPWHVWKDGQELGCQGWFETKKAAVAWIEEQKKEQERPETISNEQERPETISNEQERPETISNEQKEETKMYTWEELKTMENRFELKKALRDDVKTLETIYGKNVGMYSARPDETIAEYVQAVGYGRACAAVASLVNHSAWDGRIDKRNAAWAATVAGSLDDECCQHFDIYTNRIHMGHLNQLADELRKFTPPTETPDDHSETETTETETPENHSEQEQPAEQKEEKTMKKVEFKPDAIIVNGQEYAARYEYGETPRNQYAPTIRIFTALSGNACIVELPADDPEYMNARAVMEKADETPDDHSEPEQAETPAEQPAQDAEQEQAAQDAEQEQAAPEQAETETPDDHSETETPAQDAEQPDETPDDPKKARGPVPEKTFVGTAIKGNGYSIIFDGGLNRTRVIVTDETREKARPIIEKAGFYYSAALDSWNKKLTFRAYRAAQALAAELDKALAA